MTLPPIPDYAEVEGDEILMESITSIKKERYKVWYNKDKSPYEPFKDLKTMKYKKDLQAWLDKRGLNYEIEKYTTYGDFGQAQYQLIKKIKALYREMPFVKICNFYVGPLDGSNFRYKSAVTLPYKGERPEKPEILLQLREYLINVYGAQVAYGYEADDMLGINKGVKAHFDKDIYMVPEWHFDTKTRKLEYVDRFGSLWLNESGKLKGRGIAFFYAQLLMGDATDNIPSLKKGKYGDKTAYKLLSGSQTEEQLLGIVVQEYKKVMGGGWKERLLEQADLTFIVQKMGYHGSHYIGDKLGEFNL